MSRSVNPRPQFFDAAGDPLVAGKMYFFESGTDTAKTTYADVNLLIPNAHPVVLTGDGRLPNVFFQGTTRQKLTNSDDVQIWDVDNVSDDDIDVAFSNWSPLIIYNVTDIVQGNDGRFYISFTNGNEGNDPTTTPSEWQEIQFINVWNTNVTYQIGTTVKASDNLFYVSQTADNLGNDPVGDAVNWGPPFEGVSSITGGTGITVSGTSSVPIITADNNGVVTSITGGSGITVSGTAAVPIVTADNLGTVTSVATAGLATGGPITATGTVTVTKASAAEVATGTDDTKAVTPLAMADALLGVNNLSDVADTQTALTNLIAGNFVNRIVGADVVSASPLVLGADGDHFSVTGNTSFSAVTIADNRHFTCTFTGTPTITVGGGITLNNAGGNYTVAAGDTLVGQSTAANTVTGYIIKADGTALVAAGGGWEFVSAVTASASATVAFTGFEAGYDYMLEAYGATPATDAVTGKMELGIAGPTYRTANYVAGSGGVTTSASGVGSAVQTSYIPTDGNVWGNASNEEGNFAFQFFAPADATATRVLGHCIQHENASNLVGSTGGGFHTTAEAMDAVKFYFSAGNIAAGEFILYRRANA